MESESTKSEPSSRSRRSRGVHNSTLNNSTGVPLHHRSGDRSRHSHRSGSSHKNRKPDMAPFQTTVNLDENGREGQEIIEVQILPQDENWGENTTAITGNTSDQSLSLEDVSNWQSTSKSNGLGMVCQRYIETTFSLLLYMAAFVSPLAMVMMPKLGFFTAAFENPEITQIARTHLLACNAECKGLLVSLAARMILLALGVWAVFLRTPTATMPRIFLFRATVMLLVLISTFAYWLFYIVQVTEGTKAIVEGSEATDYKSLVSYATSFADTLLFIHYVGVVLMELRHLQPTYYIKVVRSPDGESRSYAIGQFSIQRAAVWVLQHYYTEFPIYNPYLDRLPISKSQKKPPISSFKYYEVDGVNVSQQQSQSRAVLAAHARRRDSSHNERFYEEHEYERRVKKRRARLITAAEEAFTHIRRVQNEPAPAIPLDSHEAAQAVFPSMARALQKYLRVTRQQPRHTVEAILRHLAHCLKHDMSPRAFLEPYLVESPLLQNEKERRSVQSWSLVCDELSSRPISNNSVFQLVQNDISLLITVYKLPHFNLNEEVVDPKTNKFVLRLNSETSV